MLKMTYLQNVIHRIEASNLGSWPKKFKCLENNTRKTYWVKLYPKVNHGSWWSWFLIWPFWSPYFHSLCFIVYIICSINQFAWGWSYEVVWWLTNVFSHNFWNSSWNFVLWLISIWQNGSWYEPNLQLFQGLLMCFTPYVLLVNNIC
jgi:hypothetical protein